MATVRDLDVVVFGATGDTGVVGCCFLFFQGKRLGLTRWAPAARNLSKLKKDVLDRLQGAEPGPEGLWPEAPVQADAGDYDSLVRMCSRTRCVVSCAGPFAEYGEGVVRACVAAGTHYVDITGEMPWVEKMRRRYGVEAEQKGVSIVSLAGYDSVPPDVATFLAAKAMEKEGEKLQRFEAFVGAKGGALPSGTLNTVLAGVDQGKRSALRAVTFGLLGTESKKRIDVGSSARAPGNEPFKKGSSFVPVEESATLQSNLFWSMLPGYSSLAGQFCVPHFMAPVNVNTVHHTAANQGYGGIEYRERMGGLPRGPLSLYGFLPALGGVAGASLLLLLAPLPGFSTFALKLRDQFNTPLQNRVRDQVFNCFQSTGKTYVHGYGLSQSGHKKVVVNMSCNYDAGLGFTMLSACTVAAQLARRAGSPEPTAPGFNSAVVAVGGEALVEALRDSGVDFNVRVEGISRL